MVTHASAREYRRTPMGEWGRARDRLRPWAASAYVGRMVIPRSRLAFVYGVIALLALIATWNQNLHYFGGGEGPVGVLATFWAATFANPAAVSITLDLLFFLLAATIWMVLEARRLDMPYVWLYIVGGALIAISVTFPLFMMMRERRLAKLGHVQPAIGAADLVGLLLVAVPVLGATVWSLLR